MTTRGSASRGVLWLGGAFAALIVPYVVLTGFACPTADDLTYALDTQRDGFWSAYRDQYFAWNGRYASNVFELGGPMVWRSMAGYRLVALLMIAGTIAVLHACVRFVVRDSATRLQTLLMTLGVTAVFLSGVPALGESIYWYTGSVTYQLSSLLLVSQILLVLSAIERGDTGRLRLAVAALLAAVTAGMNEVAMALTVAFYTGLLIVALVERRRPVAATAAIVLAAAVAAGLTVWLAPGNAVRSAMFPGRHDLARSIVLTAAQTVRFLGQWIASGPVLIASLMYLPIGAEVARRKPWTAVGRAGALALLAGTLLLVPLSVFPPYWATGVLGQHRTVSVAFFLFIPMWFSALTAALAVGWLPSGVMLRDGRLRVASGVLLVLLLAFTQNGYGVLADFANGRPAAFAREMAARSATLDECARARADVCPVEPIANKPVSFYVLDVSPDPADWVSAAYAGYFGVRQVVSKP